jgi:FkbM family methyltransferase
MKETLRKVIKEPVKRLLDVSGYEIVAKGKVRRWRKRLLNMKNLQFQPRSVLDGGAFRGYWSKAVADIFPGVELVLVEPNPFLREIIRYNVADIEPEPVVLDCALGDVAGFSSFNIWGDVQNDQGASLLNHVRGEASQTIQVQVETIDHIAETLGFAPDLIKLDLQGGELAALKGGQRVLQQVEVVIVEFHCLEAYLGRPSPRDVLDYMYDNEFRLHDIFDCYNRPYDAALAGGDFLFVKNSSSLLAYQGWE